MENKILEKSGKFISLKMWEAYSHFCDYIIISEKLIVRCDIYQICNVEIVVNVCLKNIKWMYDL